MDSPTWRPGDGACWPSTSSGRVPPGWPLFSGLQGTPCWHAFAQTSPRCEAFQRCAALHTMLERSAPCTALLGAGGGRRGGACYPPAAVPGASGGLQGPGRSVPSSSQDCQKGGTRRRPGRRGRGRPWPRRLGGQQRGAAALRGQRWHGGAGLGWRRLPRPPGARLGARAGGRASPAGGSGPLAAGCRLGQVHAAGRWQGCCPGGVPAAGPCGQGGPDAWRGGFPRPRWRQPPASPRGEPRVSACILAWCNTRLDLRAFLQPLLHPRHCRRRNCENNTEFSSLSAQAGAVPQPSWLRATPLAPGDCCSRGGSPAGAAGHHPRRTLFSDARPCSPAAAPGEGAGGPASPCKRPASSAAAEAAADGSPAKRGRLAGGKWGNDGS